MTFIFGNEVFVFFIKCLWIMWWMCRGHWAFLTCHFSFHWGLLLGYLAVCESGKTLLVFFSELRQKVVLLKSCWQWFRPCCLDSAVDSWSLLPDSSFFWAYCFFLGLCSFYTYLTCGISLKSLVLNQWVCYFKPGMFSSWLLLSLVLSVIFLISKWRGWLRILLALGRKSISMTCLWLEQSGLGCWSSGVNA